MCVNVYKSVSIPSQVWERFWRWQKSVRAGYELQMAVKKHEMDLARLRTEIDDAAARKTNHINNYGTHTDLSKSFLPPGTTISNYSLSTLLYILTSTR